MRKYYDKKTNNSDLENINMYIEFDLEKRVMCISNYTSKSGGGVAKRFRNKKDIIRIFANYIYNEVDIYSAIKERK